MNPNPTNPEQPVTLLHDQIRELYNVECQIILTLPELASRASSPTLRRLISGHEKPSIAQKDRLLLAANRLGFELSGNLCNTMRSLIKCGVEPLDRATNPQVTDLLIIAHCNRIKHYEIAGYGFAVSLADCLGLHEESLLLAATLDEEKHFTAQLAREGAAVFGDPLAAA